MKATAGKGAIPQGNFQKTRLISTDMLQKKKLFLLFRESRQHITFGPQIDVGKEGQCLALSKARET